MIASAISITRGIELLTALVRGSIRGDFDLVSEYLKVVHREFPLAGVAHHLGASEGGRKT